MRIRVLSDLHREFEARRLPDVDCDIVVLAGDIDLGSAGVRWAIDRFGATPVAYVMGNHECYGHWHPELFDEVRATARGSNVHVLETDALVLDGVRLLGTTLWTDFALFGPARQAGAARAAGEGMADYGQIGCRDNRPYQRLLPENTYAAHKASRAWIEAQLARAHDGPTVVITHHAPSLLSVPSQYRKDVLSAAFASDLSRLVERSGASLWVHGHCHGATDHRVGETRVICNPMGYPHEPPATTGFREDLVVDV